MGMREWVFISLSIVILLIFIDGFLRMQKTRRNQVKMSLDRNISDADFDEDEVRNNELPNGGARIISRDELSSELSQTDTENESYCNTEIDLNQNVPVLMESVEVDNYKYAEQEIAEADSSKPDMAEDSAVSTKQKVNTKKGENLPSADHIKQIELSLSQHQTPSEEESVEKEVIVINVTAKNDVDFTGRQILQAVMSCGLQLGDMNIYHRHAGQNDNGPVLFSMANIVNPGTFERDQMENFSTPGVVFFLSLPGPIENMQIFEKMLDITRQISIKLDGDIKDEARSVLTQQTIEHYRQRIRDFELRQLSNTPKAQIQ